MQYEFIISPAIVFRTPKNLTISSWLVALVFKHFGQMRGNFMLGVIPVFFLSFFLLLLLIVMPLAFLFKYSFRGVESNILAPLVRGSFLVDWYLVNIPNASRLLTPR